MTDADDYPFSPRSVSDAPARAPGERGALCTSTPDARARCRDATGAERDREAARRDGVADVADALLDERERSAGLNDRGPLTGHRVVFRAARDRERATADRARAAADRAASARDRDDAGRDRQLALADRERAAEDRAAAGADDLTGVLRRGVGLLAVQREIKRAARTGDPLVLAYVDVDGLKVVNDSHGHLAGDLLLQRTAHLIRTHLRPYDLTVRVGGDEFVCTLSGIDTDGARSRFDQVSADLASGPGGGSISVGLAELAAGDSLDGLVARADTALLAAKGADGSRPRRFRRLRRLPARR